MKTLVVGLIILLAGCSGVQIGDSGSSEDGCDFREEPLSDLAALPPGFDRTPEQMLEPVTTGISGRVTLADGRVAPIQLSFEIESQNMRAVYREETPGIDDCEAQGVKVQAQISVDGGDVLAGETHAEVRTLGPQVWIQVAAERLHTSEQPKFANEPQSMPKLGVVLQRGKNGKWHGEWAWSANVSCAGRSLCSGMESAPFGKFEAR